MRSPKLETVLSRQLLALVVVAALLAAMVGFAPASDAQLDAKQTTVRLHSGSADIFTPKTDPEWRFFVEGVLLEDLPVLEELIGLQWPLRKLVVRQLPESRRNGRAGFFAEFDDSIEVVAGQDPELLLHELSHGWFNGKTVAGDWLAEGLAEEFASRTMAITRGVVTEPTQPDLASPHRVLLSGWRARVPNPPANVQAFNRYQYNASWWVVRSITNEIGLAAFAEVLAELDVGGPKARRERLPRLPGWRALYNALEDRMDHTQLATLFGTYVAGSYEDFEGRAEAMDRYNQLFEASSLQPSPALVEALDLWWIRNANALLDAAEPYMVELEELGGYAQRLNLTADGEARRLFESASGSAGFTPMAAVIADERSDLETIEQQRVELQARADANDIAIEFTSTTIAQALVELTETEAALDAEIQAAFDAEIEAALDVEVELVEQSAVALAEQGDAEPADTSSSQVVAPEVVTAPFAVVAVVTRSNGLLFALGLAVIGLLLVWVAVAFVRQRKTLRSPIS